MTMQRWPRPGEIWRPMLPWPDTEAPTGYGIRPVGGDFAWRLLGGRNRGRTPTEARACREAWEFRFGATGEDETIDTCAEDGRLGPGAVRVDEVGATLVFGRRIDTGARVCLFARDLRLAFEPEPEAT